MKQMSILFTPHKLNELQLRNRFIFSACEDNLASEQGFVSDALIAKNRKIAQGGVGLIITSHIAVHPLGRTRKRQLGLFHDDMVPGFEKLVAAVHAHGAKIIFQLGHAGSQTKAAVIGRKPLGPSALNADMAEMSPDQIQEAVLAFRQAAERAVAARADGIQLHGAHGYLINQFLSPYFNHRHDTWGGNPENMFRFLKSVTLEIQQVLPKGMPLLIKLNCNDYTPKPGITPELAVAYAERSAGLNIHGIEVSCGTSLLSPWNMCRGAVPAKEIAASFPEPHRTKVENILSGLEGKFTMQEGYNLAAAEKIRLKSGAVPVFPVGGFRRVAHMEELVSSGRTDFISMCRPFIRQPHLVKQIQKGELDAAACTSCNRCLAAVAGDIPVRCYQKQFPKP